jgi:hypothetical protein
MNPATGTICSLILLTCFALLPSEGPAEDDSARPRVTLTVTRIRGWEYTAKELEGELQGKDVRYVALACDAVIDNQTGEELTVLSNFYSAFDGLSVQILRGGRVVAEKPYIFHQSPSGFDPQPFVLKKGKNEKDMRIPIRLPPEDWAKLEARLVGTLPGSAFKGKLTSKAVPMQRVKTLGR